MEILGAVGYYFELIGIYVVDRSRSGIIISFFKCLCFVLPSVVFFIGTSSLYIYYHLDQIVKCMRSVMCVSEGVFVTLQFLCLKLNENRIKSLIKKFRQTANGGLFFDEIGILSMKT